MTITYKILGQINPTANTMSTAYTVPASNSAVISTVVICNQSVNSAAFSLAAVASGDSPLAKNFLNFQTPVPGNDSITITIGMTLAANDSIRANATSSNISVSVFGSEIY
jgi:hypothetical protein